MFVAVGAYEPQRVCSTVCSHLDPNDCHLVLHGFTVYIVFPICGFCCVVLLFFTLFTLPPGYLGTLRSAQVLIIGGDLLGPSYVTFDPWGAFRWGGVCVAGDFVKRRSRWFLHWLGA